MREHLVASKLQSRQLIRALHELLYSKPGREKVRSHALECHRNKLLHLLLASRPTNEFSVDRLDQLSIGLMKLSANKIQNH